jgi:hypothetical protein
VIFPTHKLVRRRVVGHCQMKLYDWGRRHVRRGVLVARERDLDQLKAICASYAAHFAHAQSWRLRSRLGRRFPWLREALR